LGLLGHQRDERAGVGRIADVVHVDVDALPAHDADLAQLPITIARDIDRDAPALAHCHSRVEIAKQNHGGVRQVGQGTRQGLVGLERIPKISRLRLAAGLDIHDRVAASSRDQAQEGIRPSRAMTIPARIRLCVLGQCADDLDQVGGVVFGEGVVTG
jgi:hypothetical protein